MSSARIKNAYTQRRPINDDVARRPVQAQPTTVLYFPFLSFFISLNYDFISSAASSNIFFFPFLLHFAN